MLNSILTYLAEKLIVGTLTRKSDHKLKVRKEIAFHEQMNAYRSQAEDMGDEITERDEDITV